MTTASAELKRTPFYNDHVKLGGKIVDFAGWEMPVQYSTITLEHNAVRNAAGVFDISHMGQVLVWGPDAEDYLQYLVTNDVKKASLGKGLYAHLLNAQGGIIDDIFIYRIEDQKFLLVINASRKEGDIAWMESQINNFDVKVMEAPYAAALAIQGPKAKDILKKFSDDIPAMGHHAIAEFQMGSMTAFVGRTGYTGEDGFEIFAPAGHLLQFWEELFKVGTPMGLIPCGLGARDTLRTEVAYPLYGHELDENHTPLEAGLSWVVSFDKGNFIGKEALVKQKAAGLKQKLYGFKILSGGVARPGGVIKINGSEVGTVASGTFSPTLNYAIGMAFLPVATEKEGFALTIVQGTRELQAQTIKMPFYKKP